MRGLYALSPGALGGLLLWVAAAAPLAAQPAAQPASQPLHLSDAARITLQRAPVVESARENINVQSATLRSARGAFDASVRVGPIFEHRENILMGKSLEQEKLKRGITSGLNRNFGLVAEALEQQLKDGRADLPVCPVDGDYSLFVVTLPGTALPVPLCRPAATGLSVQSLENLDEGGGLSTGSLFRRPQALDPLAILQTQQRLASIYRVQIGVAALDVHERGLELLNHLAVIARSVEERAGLAFERLGALPKHEYTNTVSLFGQFTKPFGSGSAFQFQGTFDGRAAQFRDKPLDPIFGGRPVNNRFRTRLEAFWVQPLARGRGAESVKAPERAAARNVEAARFTFQQAAADQVLVATEAYLDLVAAQESLTLTEASLITQRRTLETTIKLVAAGDVAAADATRSRARVGDLEVAVLSARAAVVAARTRLAEAMGLTAEEAARLTAVDVFPARPAEVDLEATSKQAVTRRADVQAAQAFRDTSRILAAAARAEARPRIDLFVNGGYAEIYYGPTFRSLKDELIYVTTESTESYLRYYDVNGLGRAFGRRWEPRFGISAVIELPFGNNARLGRLAEARAAVTESEIRLADTSRVIQHNVSMMAQDIRGARAEWEQRQEAVIQYETTWDATQRLRAGGEMTLIDTLLTEQQLTDARLQLVAAKRAYASAVARFRREAGTLVSFAGSPRGEAGLAGLVEAR